MDTIANLGQFLKGPGGQSLLKVGEAGMAGAGLVGNILNERARSSEISNLQKAEKTLADPTKLASEVRGATQPLNAGLVQDITNQVSGNLAERGLSQAPGIQATELATALAPFQQQNQQTALQLVLTRLGLPLDYAKTILAGMPQNTNLAPLLALLQKGGGSSSSGGGIDPQALFNLFNTPRAPQDTSSYSTPSFLPSSGGDTGSFDLPSEIFA
jgi:hypothetical protein